MTIFDETEFKNADIRKLIKKINLYQNKGKIDKVKSSVEGLESFLKDKNSEDCREAIYVYSHLAEDHPDIINKKIIKHMDELISSENDEIRLNAVILYGTKLLERIEEGEIQGDQIDEFIDLMSDKIPEVRANVIFFIEQFPKEFYDYILPKINLFTDNLAEMDNNEVIDALLFIIDKIWQKSLPIKVSIFNILTDIYKNTLKNEKRERIAKFFASGIPEFNLYLKKNKEIKEKDFFNWLETRGPLVKIYDIEKVAREEGMKPRDVQNNFESIKGTEEIFRFIYHDKKRYYIEIELQPLLRILRKNRVKVDDLIHLFGDKELDSISLLNILIKKLVKSKNIRGYLSKSYFYSYEYIKEMLMDDIRRYGMVNLDEHAKTINYDFIVSIAEEINKETKFTGIFNKNKSLFLTLTIVMKEIEKICIKESMFDLSVYKQKYPPNDYEHIEEECKKHFFTKYHDHTNWLTNIGYTRLTNKFREAQTVGSINLKKIAEEYEIPFSITKEIITDWLEAKPGLWDNDGKIYYFTKFIKSKIGSLDKSASEDEKNKAVEKLAKELNLDKQEILKNLNREIEEIINQIKTQPRIDMNLYIRILGMKKEEFIKFVNNLNIEYLIQANEMIFDQKLIAKHKKDVNEAILRAANNEHSLFLPDLSKILKFSEFMILDIMKKYHSEGKIGGILIDEELFITKKGIKQRFIDNKDYISMETVFPERTLTEKEQKYAISILEELIDSGELIGDYNEEEKEFHSEEQMNIKRYDEEKSNAEDMLKIYVRYMADTFDKVRDIYLNKKDIRLGDVKRKDYLIKRIMDELGNWERHLLKSIERVETSFESLEDAGDMTFGEVLDIQESSKKIDSEYIMNEFHKWKQIIVDLEQNMDVVGAYKKKLNDNPNDEDTKKNLQNLYDKLHFFDKDL